LSLCFIKYHAIKTYGGTEVQVQILSTSALDGVSCQLQALAVILPGEKPQQIKSWSSSTYPCYYINCASANTTAREEKDMRKKIKRKRINIKI
jgi:hypothetical protein